jgi:outer membrane protein assembly factor BamB
VIYKTSELLFIGIRGTVLALHRRNGQVIWETTLKGYDFVNLVLDGNDLLATSKGEISNLDPATGRIRWTNPLRGYGYGMICIATEGQSQALLAAEAASRQAAADSAATANATMASASTTSTT